MIDTLLAMLSALLVTVEAKRKPGHPPGRPPRTKRGCIADPSQTALPRNGLPRSGVVYRAISTYLIKNTGFTVAPMLSSSESTTALLTDRQFSGGCSSYAQLSTFSVSKPLLHLKVRSRLGSERHGSDTDDERGCPRRRLGNGRGPDGRHAAQPVRRAAGVGRAGDIASESRPPGSRKPAAALRRLKGLNLPDRERRPRLPGRAACRVQRQCKNSVQRNPVLPDRHRPRPARRRIRAPVRGRQGSPSNPVPSRPETHPAR